MSGKEPMNTTLIGEDDLQAYIDGRLAPERSTLVEAYLAQHPEIRESVAREAEQREMLRTALAAKFNEPVPMRLRLASIEATLRAERQQRLRIAAAFLGIAFLGAGGGWFARGLQQGPGIAAAQPLTFTSDAVAAYRIFAVEKRHAVEVPASDEQHLMTWLSKRVGRPLQAPNLDRFGFKLMGGRLLPTTESSTTGPISAAQFMYEREDGRRLTLYVRAGSGAETAFRFSDEAGAATFAWIDRGFGFALTAAATRAELLPIAEDVYQAYETASSSGG
jgi:anti-sigma factor RsiW